MESWGVFIKQTQYVYRSYQNRALTQLDGPRGD